LIIRFAEFLVIFGDLHAAVSWPGCQCINQTLLTNVWTAFQALHYNQVNVTCALTLIAIQKRL